MTDTYIVLFRGINVGGRVAKMETLRNALTEAGFGNVKSYIQSGNIILTTDKSKDAVTDLVDKTFTAAFGYSSRPSVRTIKEWQRVIDDNPFAKVLKAGNQEHAVFVDAVPTAAAIEALRALATTEELELRDGVLYLHTPDGYGRSPVAAAFEKLLKGVPWTARNWNTMLKLQEMAEAARADATEP
jgi:uncharacterized protein (DUF1697 family)